jgi:hypothetical protein
MTSPLSVRDGLLAGLLVVCLSPLVSAHELAFTETTVELRPDGTFQADLICDLDALALGVPQNSDEAALVATLRALTPDELHARLEALRELFRRRVRLRFDGAPAPFDVSFPDQDTPAATESPIPTMLGLTARLSGAVPPGATDLEFFASRAFSDVHLTIDDQIRNTTTRSVLERGARSDPFTLAGPVETPTRLSVARQYLQLGFVHIVPRGLDHILFVLGLFLLGTGLRPLVWQVSAFTVAHAATLSLAALGVVALPTAVVEPLIALSIVYVAVENVLTGGLTAWRPAVVFGFGLLHGLGFAGVLGQLGLPAQERLLGLVSFNLGIELGQLLVIGVAFAAVGWCRGRRWYRTRVTLPLSVVIAAVGLFWTVERVLAR